MQTAGSFESAVFLCPMVPLERNVASTFVGGQAPNGMRRQSRFHQNGLYGRRVIGTYGQQQPAARLRVTKDVPLKPFYVGHVLPVACPVPLGTTGNTTQFMVMPQAFTA